MDNFKEIAEFIKEKIMGCKFVGISSDNELFVEFEHDDADLEGAAAKLLRKEFPYVTGITVVVRPSIAQVKEMVDELNSLLEEDKPKKGNLLDIGSF